MSKNVLNTDDLNVRPKDIDAAAAAELTGGVLSNPGVGGTAPVIVKPAPGAPASTMSTTLPTAGSATTK